MANALAPTVFKIGADNTLATVDAYAINSRTVINSVSRIASGFDIDVLKTLRGTTAGDTGLNVLGQLTKAAGSRNKTEFLARILNTTPSLQGVIRDYGSKGVDILTESMGIGQPIEVVGEDGIIRKIPGKDFSDVKNLLGLVAGIATRQNIATQGLQIRDYEALAGTISGAVKEVSDYSIPGAIKDMVENVTDVEVVNRVATKTTPTLVKNSDWQGLLAISKKASPGAVTLSTPDVITDFSDSFMLKPDVNPKKGFLEETFEGVRETYTSIKDGWDRALRGTQEVVDLSSLQGASQDMRTVMQVGARNSVDANDKLFALTEVMSKTSVKDLLREQFPYTYQAPNNTITNQVTNPALLRATIT